MLLEKLNEDLKVAMKNKEKDRLNTIRAIKTALMNEKIKLMVENLTEDQENAVLAREVKQRKDSIADFTKADRQDLVENEEKQLSVLETYLPKQLSIDEIKKLIEEVVEKVNASSMKELGKVMAVLSPMLKGKDDMSIVTQFVKEYLTK